MSAVVLDRPVVAPIAVPTSTGELVIVVTRRHVAFARSPEGYGHCAIEWALVEQGFDDACVGDRFLYLNDLRDEPFEMPESMQDWIQRFDSDEDVEDERFVIRTPAAQTVSGQ